jgi:hypothetical protein
MKRIALLMGVATLLGATQLMAQAKPSFAGTWTLVPDSAAAAAAAGGGARGGGRGGLGGLGQTVTITQDAATLTTTSTTQAGEVKSVYKLDGTDSKNSRTMGAGRAGGTAAPIETVSQAKWDANKLVITTNINFNGNAFSTTMSMSLDASGQLIVESTNARAGGTPTIAKYKKG